MVHCTVGPPLSNDAVAEEHAKRSQYNFVFNGFFKPTFQVCESVLVQAVELLDHLVEVKYKPVVFGEGNLSIDYFQKSLI